MAQARASKVVLRTAALRTEHRWCGRYSFFADLLNREWMTLHDQMVVASALARVQPRGDELFISSLRTKSGTPDRMFYFGFDSPDRVAQTRGAPERRDLSEFTLKHRLPLLRAFLDELR
jgi:hypothetical protein